MSKEENQNQLSIPELKKILPYRDLIWGGPWDDFENEFEEGWADDPDTPTLANHVHHLDVANETARELSKTYKDYNEYGLATIADRGKLQGQIYARIAKEMYPKDRIWWGNESEDPEYWKESVLINKYYDWLCDMYPMMGFNSKEEAIEWYNKNVKED